MRERTNHVCARSKPVADVPQVQGETAASSRAVMIRVVDVAGGIWEGIGEDVACALYDLRASASRRTSPPGPNETASWHSSTG
jgi:hypothetical protein